MIYNAHALEYAKQELIKSQQFLELEPIDQLIVLELAEQVVILYLDGLFRGTSDPNSNKIQ